MDARSDLARDLSVVNMRRGAVLSVVLLCGVVAVSARRGNDAQQSFPLSPGTYWIYRGLVRSQEEGSTPGKVTDVTWKMSIVRAVERDGSAAFIVSGFPRDLDWSDGNTKPQVSILIRTPEAKFYWHAATDPASTLKQLDDVKYPLREMTIEDDWFLELPLAEGRKFCDAESMKRTDGEYCWVAGTPHPAALDEVKGITPGKRTAYEVDYRTNPDDTEFEFTPGVGITKYEYHHHGTIADTELHLVEFHAGDEPNR